MINAVTMPSGFHLRLIAVLLLLSACDSDPLPDKIKNPGIQLTNNGAWCWFQDPRAVYISGQRKRTYAGWVTNEGMLKVGAYDHSSGHMEVTTIKEEWGIDDHNTNSFLVLPDKRIMVFYARHNKTGLFSRVTLQPEDISKWADEIVVSDGHRITYNHPVYLSKEKRFYVFWRGESLKPTFSTSVDGITWSAPKVLIQSESSYDKRIRPYIKVVSDGKSEIHFSFTDGHPQTEPGNSIYYMKYKEGKLFKANNTLIGSMNDLPIRHGQSDTVYDGNVNRVRSWVWDIAIDDGGSPVIAYTRFPKKTDHRYHYAYWAGNKWHDTEITPGGKWFPKTQLFSREKEPYYSGGIAIDHMNTSVVYVSKEIDGVFEIEKWTRDDNSKNWTPLAITRGSIVDNVRPVVPRGHKNGAEHILWMKGNYVHFTNYSTGVYMHVSQPISP